MGELRAALAPSRIFLRHDVPCLSRTNSRPIEHLLAVPVKRFRHATHKDRTEKQQQSKKRQQNRKLIRNGPKMQSLQRRVHDDRNINKGGCGYESVTRAHTYAKTEKNNNDKTIRQKSRSAMHRCIFKIGETTSPGIRCRSTVHRRYIVLWILFESTQANHNQ